MFCNNKSQIIVCLCLKARTGFQHAIAGVASPVVIHILGAVEVSSLGTTQRT